MDVNPFIFCISYIIRRKTVFDEPCKMVAAAALSLSLIHIFPVDEFYAAGGISQKDPMTMQIYADIINMPIKIAGSTQGPALGSSIFGAVAAGKERGGYDSVFEAAGVMGKLKDVVYTPIPENVEVYNKLFA